MTAHALTTEALIRRALSACKAEGLAVGAVEVSPDGTVRILAPSAAAALASARGGQEGNTCDGLFGE